MTLFALTTACAPFDGTTASPEADVSTIASATRAQTLAGPSVSGFLVANLGEGSSGAGAITRTFQLHCTLTKSNNIAGGCLVEQSYNVSESVTGTPGASTVTLAGGLTIGAGVLTGDVNSGRYGVPQLRLANQTLSWGRTYMGFHSDTSEAGDSWCMGTDSSFMTETTITCGSLGTPPNVPHAGLVATRAYATTIPIDAATARAGRNITADATPTAFLDEAAVGIEYGITDAHDGDVWNFTFARPDGGAAAVQVAYSAPQQCFTLTDAAGAHPPQCGSSSITVFAFENHNCSKPAVGSWSVFISAPGASAVQQNFTVATRCSASISGTTLTRGKPGELLPVLANACTPHHIEWRFNGGDGGIRTSDGGTTITMVDSDNAYNAAVNVYSDATTVTCTATAPLTVQGRDGGAWTTVPTLVPEADNVVSNWGAIPTFIDINPPGVGGSPTLVSAFDPAAYVKDRVFGKLWNMDVDEGVLIGNRSTALSQVTDPSGPNDGLWYVANTSLAIHVKSQINKYIKEGGPVPDDRPFFNNFWHENLACSAQGFSPADFVQAIKDHEDSGGGKPGATGHFGLIRDAVKTQDPRKAVESRSGASNTALVAVVEAKIDEVERALKRSASENNVHGNWPPSNLAGSFPHGTFWQVRSLSTGRPGRWSAPPCAVSVVTTENPR